MEPSPDPPPIAPPCRRSKRLNPVAADTMEVDNVSKRRASGAAAATSGIGTQQQQQQQVPGGDNGGGNNEGLDDFPIWIDADIIVAPDVLPGSGGSGGGDGGADIERGSAGGGDGIKQSNGPGNGVVIVAPSNADAFVPLVSTRNTSIPSSFHSARSPFDIDTIRCELNVSKLHLFQSSINVGGRVSLYSTSHEQLNTHPYLLVSSSPVLFVKCKNNSVEEFNELRERLVAAFSGVFAITCAQPCSDDAASVETISNRSHHLDVTTFINVLSSCDIETVTFIEYNLKSPLANASQHFLPNLMKCVVSNTFVSMDIGTERISSMNNEMCFTLFHHFTQSESDNHLSSSFQFDSQVYYRDRRVDIVPESGEDTLAWHTYNRKQYSQFGSLTSGSIELSLLPTPLFVAKHSLSPTHLIRTKLYSCITHIDKSRTSFSEPQMMGVTRNKAEAYSQMIRDFEPWYERHKHISGVFDLQRQICSYRIEFSVHFCPTPAPLNNLLDFLYPEELFNQVHSLGEQLMNVLYQLRQNPIRIAHYSYSNWRFASVHFNNLLSAIKFTTVNLYIPIQQAYRLAFVASVFGHSPIFVQRNLLDFMRFAFNKQHIPLDQCVEYLWNFRETNAEVIALRHRDHAETRAEAIEKTYTLTLTNCGEDNVLFTECQNLYPELVFRWQHGKQKTNSFIVYYNTSKNGIQSKQRSSAYTSPARLLLECAKFFRQYKDNDDDDSVTYARLFKLDGNQANTCEPKIDFVNN